VDYNKFREILLIRNNVAQWNIWNANSFSDLRRGASDHATTLSPQLLLLGAPFFSVTSRSSDALDPVLAVTSYQLLFLDRENQVQLVRSLYGEDDAAAIVTACDIIAGRAAELWNGSRLVMKFG
jgi:hypothetical protein